MGQKATEKTVSARAAIVKAYGCGQRGYDRWNIVGKEVGEPVPWEQGPQAVINWVRRHDRRMPPWLARAAVGMTVNIPAPLVVPAPVVVRESVDSRAETPLDVIDGIISDVLSRIAAARAMGADPATLSSFGKDYTALLDRRNALVAAMRATDDGLVAMDRVVQTVDMIHGAIADRIEGALANAKQEAETALAAGRWPEFCERFRSHHLDDLARVSFGVHLSTAA